MVKLSNCPRCGIEPDEYDSVYQNSRDGSQWTAQCHDTINCGVYVTGDTKSGVIDKFNNLKEGLMNCDHCTGVNGEKIYPHFGIVPRNKIINGGMVKSNMFIMSSEGNKPVNFVEDDDVKGSGTYYCPKCNNGRKQNGIIYSKR